MMTDPRHIHDYLDGTIDADAETSLFASLASDPDARRELNDQIRLHLAVKKDLAAIAAPADAAAAIFGELGYTLPPDLAPAPAPAPKRRRWLLPLWFLLFLGTGIIATRMWWPRTITVGTVQGYTQGFTQDFVQSSTQGFTQDFVQGSTQGHTQGSAQERTQRPTQSPTQSPTQRLTVDSMGDSMVDSMVDLVISPTQSLNQGLIQRPTHDLPHSPSQGIPQRIPQGLPQRLPQEQWRLMGQGVSTLSTTPAFGTDSAAGSSFSQFTVGVAYHLTDDDVVSVVGGRQLVAQEFVRNEWGRDVTYRQTPLLWWAGVSAEHSFSDLAIANAITPYASGTLGWMQTGPMARLGAGIHLFRHQQLSFDLGVEGSIMAYPIQSTYYTSTTFTISYGLSYRF